MYDKMQENVIKVNMLGGFSIWKPGMAEPVSIDLNGRAGRLWTLAAYLILHRETGVSTQELIEMFWPDNTNPSSTLQNNISRLRAALADMGFTDTKQLVRCEGSFYRWSSEPETVVDIDVFESLCQREHEETDLQKRIELEKQAFFMYKDDFLPECAAELWCLNLNAYYRSLYLRLCRNAAANLMQQKRLQELVKLCNRVIRLDPLAEEFSVYLMRALVASKAPRKAIDHYDHIRQLYQQTYGTTPSPELEAEKIAAMQQLYGQDVDERDIRGFLFCEDQTLEAFYCSNDTFRAIVNLQLREMKRYKTSAQIMVVRLSSQDVSPEESAVYMRQMETSLQHSLRAGDPFTRMGAAQYWVLLPGAKLDSAEAIFARISKQMKRDYPQSKATFSYKMLDLRSLSTPDR